MCKLNNTWFIKLLIFVTNEVLRFFDKNGSPKYLVQATASRETACMQKFASKK